MFRQPHFDSSVEIKVHPRGPDPQSIFIAPTEQRAKPEVYPSPSFSVFETSDRFENITRRQQQSPFATTTEPSLLHQQRSCALKSGSVALTRPILGIENVGDAAVRSAATRAAVAIYESERNNEDSVASIAIFDGVATMRVTGMHHVFVKALDSSTWNASEEEASKIDSVVVDADARTVSVRFLGSATAISPPPQQQQQHSATFVPPFPGGATSDILVSADAPVMWFNFPTSDVSLSEKNASSSRFETPVPDRIAYSSDPNKSTTTTPPLSTDGSPAPTKIEGATGVASPPASATYDDMACNIARELAHAAIAEALWASDVRLDIQVFEPRAKNEGCFVASIKGMRSFDKRVFLPERWTNCMVPQMIRSTLNFRYDVPTNDLRIRIGMQTIKDLYAQFNYLKAMPSSDSDRGTSDEKQSAAASTWRSWFSSTNASARGVDKLPSSSRKRKREEDETEEDHDEKKEQNPESESVAPDPKRRRITRSMTVPSSMNNTTT